MTPSPFGHGSRSHSSPILYSELPICNTGPYPPSLAPHETFPLVDGFGPNSPLNPTTATIPSSVGPLLFKFMKRKQRKLLARVFHQISRHLQVGFKKNQASPRFFNPLLIVLVPDKTLLFMFDIYHMKNVHFPHLMQQRWKSYPF